MNSHYYINHVLHILAREGRKGGKKRKEGKKEGKKEREGGKPLKGKNQKCSQMIIAFVENIRT